MLKQIGPENLQIFGAFNLVWPLCFATIEGVDCSRHHPKQIILKGTHQELICGRHFLTEIPKGKRAKIDFNSFVLKK
jgi:hypothetical protein